MTDEQVTRIKFEFILACIIIGHCQHQQAKIKIRGCLYGLQRQGLVKRIGKDLWISVKPEQQKPKEK